MARRLVGLAEQFSNSRIAFLLEGGYDLAALRNSVVAVLNAMRGGSDHEDNLPTSAGERLRPLIRRIQQAHEKYR
jgi:acetoin utilization deacetylase AcuC-like enzyme